MFTPSKPGNQQTNSSGKSVYVPAGKQICPKCDGNKTMTFGSQCSKCCGKGYV